MDYYNHSCPVCEKEFDKDSDTVVCPVCGAPHHRDCYEQEDRCFFEDKHKDGFDYKNYYQEQKIKECMPTDNTLRCATCGSDLVPGSRFCNHCGTPVENTPPSPYDRHTEEQNSANNQPNRNQVPPQGVHVETFAFDPMGGLKADEEVGDGVTVGEVAKFTKNNSPFYSRLFHQIKNHNRSRFTLSGFLFSGGWLLYRKMYKLGTIITIAMAILIGAQLYINTFYGELITELSNISYNSPLLSGENTFSLMLEFLGKLSMEELIAIGISYFSGLFQLAIRILCGIFGHRWYYKHCMKKITQIKSEAPTKEEADATLQTKGGVNTTLAISLVISYFALNLIPFFF